VAIPIALSANPDGKRGVKLFIYHQWDDNQMCKSGDWLVHNGDDVYTVDRETFEQTYIYQAQPRLLQKKIGNRLGMPRLEGWHHQNQGRVNQIQGGRLSGLQQCR